MINRCDSQSRSCFYIFGVKLWSGRPQGHVQGQHGTAHLCPLPVTWPRDGINRDLIQVTGRLAWLRFYSFLKWNFSSLIFLKF